MWGMRSSWCIGGVRRRKRKRHGRDGAQTWLCCLRHIFCLLGGPELFVLLATEALVVVAFAFEQLLIVGFAVKFTLKSCKGAKAAWEEERAGRNQLYANWKQKVKLTRTGQQGIQSPQFGVAVLAAEACWMEDQVVGDQSLHRVDRFLTWGTHFLLGLEAEGLSTQMYGFVTGHKRHTRKAGKTSFVSLLEQQRGGWERRQGFTLDRWTGFSSVVFLVSWKRQRKKKKTLH